MIYYMCKYSPLELFAGFGEQCQRLELQADSFETADSLGHQNICGYGKGFLQAAMDPKVQRLVLINCCDVVRRIYDILKEHKQMEFLWILDLPHGNGRTDRKMLGRQLLRMLKAYQEKTGQLYDCSLAMDAWSHTAEGVQRPQGKYLSLQGAHGGPLLYETVKKVFDVPVTDDTCSGNRSLVAPENACSDQEELCLSYAAALLGQMPCLRMKDVSQRRELQKHPAGIIYHTMKFCDYYGFEYASIKNGTTPILKIETDGTRQSEGQLSTRLEAFAESLQLMGKERSLNKDKKYVAGIDSGSTSTDVAIMDRKGQLVAWSIVRTGIGAAKGADKALKEALEKAGLSEDDLGTTVATGYGRGSIGKGDSQVTEITCHAKGAHYLCPDARTIIDIGGQDSKVIRVDDKGNVINFVMNDKCAAGTGRFLEMMARTMDLSLEEMSRMGLRWKKEVTISSMCTVFAESEVVSLIAENRAPEDIIHGLNQAVAVKTAALAKRVSGEDHFMMSGGVSRNKGLVQVLEEKLGERIEVPEMAQLCGAIGAALIALEG